MLRFCIGLHPKVDFSSFLLLANMAAVPQWAANTSQMVPIQKFNIDANLQ